jgi:hypothetical protein
MRYWLSETIPKASIFIFLNELNKIQQVYEDWLRFMWNAILNLRVANTLSSDRSFFTNVTLRFCFQFFSGSIQSGLKK